MYCTSIAVILLYYPFVDVHTSVGKWIRADKGYSAVTNTFIQNERHNGYLYTFVLHPHKHSLRTMLFLIRFIYSCLVKVFNIAHLDQNDDMYFSDVKRRGTVNYDFQLHGYSLDAHVISM